MQTYNLFLDDVRFPTDCFTYTREPRYNIEEWVIVRSYEEFKTTLEDYLSKGKFPKLIAFDHDLGDEHIQDLFSDKNFGKLDSEISLNYDSYKEKTGYCAAKFLVNICLDKNLELPEFIIHSMNPVGKKNILSLLDNFKNRNNE